MHHLQGTFPSSPLIQGSLLEERDRKNARFETIPAEEFSGSRPMCREERMKTRRNREKQKQLHFRK